MRVVHHSQCVPSTAHGVTLIVAAGAVSLRATGSPVHAKAPRQAESSGCSTSERRRSVILRQRSDGKCPRRSGGKARGRPVGGNEERERIPPRRGARRGGHRERE